MLLLLQQSLDFSNLYTEQRTNQRKTSKDELKPLFLPIMSFSLMKPKNQDQFCKTTYIAPNYMKVEVLFTKVNNVPFAIHPFPNPLAIKVNSYICGIFCNVFKSILQTKLI